MANPGKTLPGKSSTGDQALRVFLLLGIIYAFLVSLELMGLSVKMLGRDFADDLVANTSNPFIGLFVGLLATAIIQSSSTTTSMVVILVGSGAFGPASDPEAISHAVPIIMGANIGTSITSTIVSLGHITHLSEYRKAVAAATVHDFFNIATVLILFPLEMLFGILSRPATALADWLYVDEGASGVLSGLRFVKNSVEPAAQGVMDGAGLLFGQENAAVPIVALVLSLVLLFLALRSMTLYFRRVLIGRQQERVEKVLFGHPVKALAWGTGLTALAQSSSVTTSLIVPLVATNRVSLTKAFPFVMGANIGTTTTALFAALLAPGIYANAGLAIAFCHILFNLIGVAILFPFSKVRGVPVYLARKLGQATVANRFVGIAYLAVAFFLIPFLLIIATTDLSQSGGLPSVSKNSLQTPTSGRAETPRDSSLKQ